MSQRTGQFDMSCIYSTVINNSGIAKTFGFLPPHGVKLEAGEQFTVFGNILEAISRGEHVTDRRQHQALVDALDRLDLIIQATPSQILTDTGNGDVKMLRLHSGSLSTVDPCWLTSDSDEVLAV